MRIRGGGFGLTLWKTEVVGGRTAHKGVYQFRDGRSRWRRGPYQTKCMMQYQLHAGDNGGGERSWL